MKIKVEINRSQNRKYSEFDAKGGLNTVDIHSVDSSFFLKAENVIRSEVTVLSKRPGYVLQSSGYVNGACGVYNDALTTIIGFESFNPKVYYKDKAVMESIKDLEFSPKFKDVRFNAKLSKLVGRLDGIVNYGITEDTNILKRIYYTYNGTQSYITSLKNYSAISKPFIYNNKIIIPVGDVRDQMSNELNVDKDTLDFLPIVVGIPIEKDDTYYIKYMLLRGRTTTAAEVNNFKLGFNIAQSNPYDSISNVDDGIVVSSQGLLPSILKTPELGDLIDYQHFYINTPGTTLQVAWEVIDPSGAILISDYNKDTGKVTKWRDWDANKKFILSKVISLKFTQEGKYLIKSTIIDKSKVSDPDVVAYYKTSQTQVSIDSDKLVRTNVTKDIFTTTGVYLDKNTNQLILYGGSILSSALYYLQVDDIEYAPFFQFFSTTSRDKDVIKGIANYGKGLIIFGQKNIYQYIDKRNNIISDGMGLLAPNSIQDVGFGLIFLSTDGLKIIISTKSTSVDFNIFPFGREVKYTVNSLQAEDSFSFFKDNIYNIVFSSNPIMDYKNYNGVETVFENQYKILKYDTTLKEWLMDSSIIFKDFVYADVIDNKFTIVCNNSVYRQDKNIYTDNNFKYDMVLQPNVTDLGNRKMVVKPRNLYIDLFAIAGTELDLSVVVDSDVKRLKETEVVTINRSKDGSTPLITTKKENIPNIVLRNQALFDRGTFGNSQFDNNVFFIGYNVNIYSMGKNATQLNFTLTYRGEGNLGYRGGMWEYKSDRIKKNRGDYNRR